MIYIRRQHPLYTPWWKRSWRWWYVAFGSWRPFKRFGHGGWVYLGFNWLSRNWNTH